MAQIYKLPLVLEPQPEGGWTITYPLLPNLITEADTMAKVIPNVTDALECLIDVYKQLNLPLPEVLRSLNQNAPFLTDAAF